jgi:alpha-galactosidase
LAACTILSLLHLSIKKRKNSVELDTSKQAWQRGLRPFWFDKEASRMKSTHFTFALLVMLSSLAVLSASRAHAQSAPSHSYAISGGNLTVEAFDDGSYALRSSAISGNVLRSEILVDTAAGTLRASLYPRHIGNIAPFQDELGSGRQLTVTHTGLPGTPELVCRFRVYEDQPWGDIQVSVNNSTEGTVAVQAIHIVKSNGGVVLQLNGPASEDRVLSDNFSENPVQLMDLGQPADGLHLAFGSQLIYNRKSGESFFLGALSADRLLTGLHLLSTVGPDAHVLSYDVADEGTNEALQDQYKDYPPANNVPLRLQVAAGTTISSERLMFAIGSNYHTELENYGRAIRILHKPPVSIAAPIMGWWSWTAYYYGITQNTTLTNAAWLAQNLESLGYRFCFVDEGYQFARGEYATPDAKAFPRGVAFVSRRAEDQGLNFGMWVAPFQVSNRSWVYEHHKDWLVHNLDGEPIHIGTVGGKFEELYALDPTNPGAQDYLRYTYRTLVKDWGVRFIKMDFMDNSAVEGIYYRPNTTALEALRIGLEVIRSTVGDDVILDKDGSFMLTPVGIVNTGRIGQDTGHTFGSTHDAATGVAARYYMNRNFYISDPDAFTVSRQVIGDRIWHGNKTPLTLEEAEDSIALAAISGGMFEIGDDLPALGASADRVALVKNPDLLDMVGLGRASVPLDLMTYRPEDKQPSIFLLKENGRQQILTIFNWTEQPLSHTLSLGALGLNAKGSYTANDVLRSGSVPIEGGTLAITLPPHSVRMLKMIDSSVSEIGPGFGAHAPADGRAGDMVPFRATEDSAEAPVLQYHWEFGDGVSADGADVSHAYTQSGQYRVTVTATGLNRRTLQHTLGISVSGAVPTAYNPAAKERYSAPN